MSTTTPNMNLVKPTPGQTPGPDWAQEIVGDLDAIDSHDHTTGKGVPITTDALSINADLPLNGNSVTGVKAVVLDQQSAALSTTDAVYDVAGDLYYTDGAGNQIRITQSGSVTGSTGTITGLPSGTASAAYSAGTFSFQSATNTPATMSIGPIVTGAQTASPKTVTISASASQAANYALTWPLALPAATSVVTVDTSGNMGFGTITSGTYSPTVTNTTGTTTAVASSFSYYRIGNRVVVNGRITAVLSSAAFFCSITLPILPTNNFSATTQAAGGIFSGNSGQPLFANLVTSTISAKTVDIFGKWDTGASAMTGGVSFTYDCT